IEPAEPPREMAEARDCARAHARAAVARELHAAALRPLPGLARKPDLEREVGEFGGIVALDRILDARAEGCVGPGVSHPATLAARVRWRGERPRRIGTFAGVRRPAVRAE